MAFLWDECLESLRVRVRYINEKRIASQTGPGIQFITLNNASSLQDRRSGFQTARRGGNFFEPETSARVCRWVGRRRQMSVRAVNDVSVLVLSHEDMVWAVAHDYRLCDELSSALRKRRLVIKGLETVVRGKGTGAQAAR